MFPALTLFCSLATTLTAPCGISQWETRLGSEVFKIREQASRDLLATNNLRLCRFLIKSKDCEVVRRARLSYAIIKAGQLDNLAPYPCLDALMYDSKSGRYTYWEDPREYVFLCRYGINPYGGSGGAYWSSYRKGSRLWASDLLDCGVPIQVIRTIFQNMHRRDNIAGYGYKRN